MLCKTGQAALPTKDYNKGHNLFYSPKKALTKIGKIYPASISVMAGWREHLQNGMNFSLNKQEKRQLEMAYQLE